MREYAREKGLLTEREIDVLRLVARGYSSQNVAKELCIATNTVHVHRQNIMKKLNIHKASGLTWYALKNGIIKIRRV
jgi:two-component system NarL family response regulator